MMDASFEYRLTKEEYVRALRVVMTVLLAKDRRKTWRCLQLYAVIAVAIGMAETLHRGSFPGTLVAFAIYILGCWVLNSRQTREWHGLSYEPGLAECKVIFDASGVTKIRPHDERHWDWPAVRRIHELPDAVVLEFVGWEVINLPDRLWLNPEERAEFVSAFRGEATSLLPDFPADKLNSAKTLTPLHVGAFAAAIGSMLVMAVLSGSVLIAILPPSENWPSRVELISGTIVIVSIVTALVTGRSAKAGLDRLDKNHPRTARGVSIALITALVAVIIALFLIRRCGC